MLSGPSTGPSYSWTLLKGGVSGKYVLFPIGGAGTGKAGHGDSPSLDVRYYYPTGVALGAANTLYVADHHNHRVRRITW